MRTWSVSSHVDADAVLITAGSQQGLDLIRKVFLDPGDYVIVELPTYIASIRAIYGAKLLAMVSALSRHMPNGVTWTEPEGGLFLWLQLPQGVDATEVSFFALKQKVAFVSGEAFFCNGSGQNTMRLNFGYPSQEQIEEGVRRLAEVIRRAIKSLPPDHYSQQRTALRTAVMGHGAHGNTVQSGIPAAGLSSLRDDIRGEGI